MHRARFEYVSAGIGCVLWACGEPPEPPGAVMSRDATEPAGGSSVAVLEAQPNAPEPAPVAPEPGDAGASAAMTPSPEVGSRERSFTACTASSSVACDYIYVAMQEEGTDLCLQLTLDNCGGYQRPGLPVDVPVSWRLASASVGASTAGCIPDVYDVRSVPVTEAAGNISWNASGRRPSELAIDITVEPARAPGIGLDAGSISLSTAELVDALPDCDE